MLQLLLAVMIAQADVSSPPLPSPALVDRFVAAFPQELRFEVFELRADAAGGDRLIALNPRSLPRSEAPPRFMPAAPVR